MSTTAHATSAATSAADGGPTKFSRYRAVRQAAASPSDALPTSAASSQNASIARSMSRYRSKRTSKPDLSHYPLPPSAKPSTPKSPQAHLASLAALTGESISSVEDLERRTPSRDKSVPSSHTSPGKARLPDFTSRPVDAPVEKRNDPIPPKQVPWEALCAARERTRSAQFEAWDAKGVLQEETERVDREQAHQLRENEMRQKRREIAAAQGTRIRASLQAEQRAKDEAEIERLEKARRAVKQRHEEQAARRSEEPSRPEGHILGRRSSFRQKFGSFRKRPVDVPSSENVQRVTEDDRTGDLAAQPPPKAQHSHGLSVDASGPGQDAGHTWVDAPVNRPIAEEPVTIDPSQFVDAPISRPAPKDDGLVILPQVDVPVSAVNAGQRLVKIKYNGSSITLPVTPTTTPTNLLESASGNMTDKFDLHSMKLVEAFHQLGLERPLRKYEHVRDVMNSWDTDNQNLLLIAPFEAEERIDIGDAPKLQPLDTSVYMYHSQRPGTWNKRWITLRTDGQVTVAKRPGQETSNICHLTDCDVYIPTAKQAKRLRTPKKICFAAKSQQKSNVFLDGANFVHFFATSDKVVAGEWYKALQTWRSWYLVNVMGEGEKSKQAVGRLNGKSVRGGSIDATTAIHDHVPGTGLTRTPTKTTNAHHTRKPSSRDWAAPPSSFPTSTLPPSTLTSPNKLAKTPSGAATTTSHPPPIQHSRSPSEMEASSFAPTGLLGRTYSQRQRQIPADPSHSQTPSATAPLNPTSAPKLTNTTNNLTRNTSTRSTRRDLVLPKPLIDLTPTYQEPPQHARRGRGVRAPQGQALVNVATGLELQPGVIVTPSATAWRRDAPAEAGWAGAPAAGGGDGGAQIGDDKDERGERSMFVAGGLLARSGSRRGQGAAGGKGVRTGELRGKGAEGKTLVDLNEESKFAEGSLLRKVESGEKA